MKPLLCLLLILATIAVNAQVQLNCCGIKQAIPVFKDDTNFNLSHYYSHLTTKNILKPITQSDAPVEIRFIILGMDMDSDIGIIKCTGDHIIVNRYQSAVRVFGTPIIMPDEKIYYKDYKDIGSKKPGDGLTNLVKTTNLSEKFKSFNWNVFLKQLIENHLFDIPAGKTFIDSLKSIYPGDYYSTVYDIPPIIIQVKVGNRFRNLRYDGYGFPKGAPGINLAEFEQDFVKLLESIFYIDK